MIEQHEGQEEGDKVARHHNRDVREFLHLIRVRFCFANNVTNLLKLGSPARIRKDTFVQAQIHF